MPTTIFQRGPAPDLLFWAVITALSHLTFSPDPTAPEGLIISGLSLAAEALAVYAHLRYGLRSFVANRAGLGRYVLVLPLTFAAGVLAFWGLLALLSLFVYGLDETLTPAGFARSWLVPLTYAILPLQFVTAGCYLLARRRAAAARERALVAARTQAELAYLRGQLNPHFLFNALNSIYVLIDREPARARDSLTGFSDLLRYQLYRSEAEWVPLSEELEQVSKFVALSRLRLEDDFRYRVTVTGPVAQRRVPPMLLLPLVENAFKYAPALGGWVDVAVTNDTTTTSFAVRDNVSPRGAAATHAAPTPEISGGIGLANIRRRLELLFPGEYALRAGPEAAGAEYRVQLSLPAPPNPIP